MLGGAGKSRVPRTPVELEAVEPVKQLLLVLDGWVNSEVAASSSVGDKWSLDCDGPK